MNMNLEPGYLIEDFCEATQRISVGGNAVFDDEADREAFLTWIYADRTRASRWADLRVFHAAATDADLIKAGKSDPLHGWVPCDGASVDR